MRSLDTSQVRKRIVARVYRAAQWPLRLEHQLWETGHLETVINAIHASIVEPLLWRRPVDRHDYIWKVINADD